MVATLSETTAQRWEYQVLFKKEAHLTESFDPEKLTKILNEAGSQGWDCVAAVVAEVKGMFGGRPGMFFVMKRPVTS